MKNEILEYLKERLIEKYDDLEDESGCSIYTVHGPEWLSVAEIVKIIDEVDEDFC